MIGSVSVWVGCLLAAGALWTVDPLWALLPAVSLVMFGMLFDDDRG